MNKKSKIYFGCLVGLFFISMLLNIKTGAINKHNKNITMMYIHIAEGCTKAKLYEISNFYYKVAMKISSKPTKWLDFNIAKNIIQDQWSAELTPNKISKLQEAIQHLDIEIKKHPNNADINAEYAYAYHLLQDFDKAIEYYEKVLQKIPEWEYGLQELSSIYTNIKFDYKKALEYRNRKMEVSINEGYYGDYFAKAFILSKLERRKEAIDYYKKYIEHNPTHVAGYVNIAHCEVYEGLYEDAEIHVNEGLKLAPTFSYLLEAKIDILQHKHEFEKAKKLAEELLMRDQYNYSSYWTFAELKRYEGNSTEAEEFYQKAKENAQEYYDKFCDNPYDIGDADGKCGNRYEFLQEFEKSKKKPLNF